MQQSILFPSPIWYFKEPLPNQAYDWALNYKKNSSSIVRTNRGGWHSPVKPLEEFYFKNHILNIINKNFKPINEGFKIDAWWLSINQKGDYNHQHIHSESSLSAIWYITNNEGLLWLDDPLIYSRNILYDKIFRAYGETPSKNIFCNAGDLLIFPSDIPHRVEEHTLDTPRISVSFNMTAKH